MGQQNRLVRFGDFSVDLRTGEIEGPNGRQRLQDQPLRVLTVLMECPGDVVSREDLRRRVWPGDTFVNFDNALSTAIKKLRKSLGDSVEHPNYVETLPKKGYRFIAPLEFEGGAEASAVLEVFPTSPRVDTEASSIDLLRDENRRLKGLVADLTLERERLREICLQHSIPA